MSRTDKTRPYWVKLKQDPQARYEKHDHTRGPCDIDGFELDPHVSGRFQHPHTNCWIGVNYYTGSGQIVYGRPSRAVQYYQYKHNRSAKAQERLALRDAIRSTDREDVDIPPTRHRHSALWDAF